MPDYWKSEYENLRRKKKKEIEQMKRAQALFVDKTWKLLKLLGMPEREILGYYRNENRTDQTETIK